MHELALAMGLLERIQEEAQRAGLTRVKKIELEIGALNQVEPQLLTEAFAVVAESTLAQGAELEWTEIPARGRCRACGEVFSPGFTYYVCPQCKRADVEILQGKDLFLKVLHGEDEK
jgi:hydrogenase nickel incorporation protein HypA/HybF